MKFKKIIYLFAMGGALTFFSCERNADKKAEETDNMGNTRGEAGSGGAPKYTGAEDGGPGVGGFGVGADSVEVDTTTSKDINNQ